MLCKKCGGFITMSWNEDDIKDGLFIIEGECEMCQAKYAIAMQIFEMSKLKSWARLWFSLDVVQACRNCPSRIGGKGVGYSCDSTGKRIKDSTRIPKWCPLEKLVR